MFKFEFVALFGALLLTYAWANPVTPASLLDSGDEDKDEQTFQQLNEMISRVQQNLVSKTQSITESASAKKEPLTDEEVALVSQLRKRYESLENFRRLLTEQKRKQQESKQRYQECIRSLGKAICDQNTTFYLWAQMLAKDILSRPMGEE